MARTEPGSDAAQLHSVANSDAASLARLYERHAGPLFGYLYRLAEPDACTGFLPLCEDLLRARDYDTVFRRFVSFLYAERVTGFVSRPWGARDPSDAMFSPQKIDRLEFKDRARVVASLDPARRERLLYDLHRALEVDSGNSFVRDLLDAISRLSHKHRGAQRT